QRMYLSGRNTYGIEMLLTCHDWTSVDPSWSDGVITGDPLAGVLFWDGAASTTGCSLKWRLLCVGTALTRPLHADPARGRFAFASAEGRWFAADAGVAAFDAECAAEASTAHLPGNYKALIATKGAPALSRFDLNG